MFRLRSMRMASVALAFGAVAVASAFNFVFTNDGTMTAQGMTAITQAGARWTSIYTDNIQVNITVGFQNIGGPGAFTSQSLFVGSYLSARAAMATDATTVDDATSVANLPITSLSFITNRTTQNGGSATPYLDNNGSSNNTSAMMTRANLKALGLIGGIDNTLDATIIFGTSGSWDFDPTNGIGGALFDFTGVATHEIGHAMGYVSGVDRVDSLTFQNGPQSEDIQFLSPLDFHRFSTRAAVTQRDFTMDTTSKFFSINGGATNLGPFSSGVNFGDGNQASHWENRPPATTLGIMDPVGQNGELMSITALDRRAFDVIGYNLVPEPATMAALGLGVLALIRRRRAR